MEVPILITLSESGSESFPIICSGVESSLSKARNKFEAWRKILESGDTARDEKFATLNRSSSFRFTCLSFSRSPQGY